MLFFLGIVKLKQQHICRLVASTRFSKITDHFHKKFGHTCAEDSDGAFYSRRERQQAPSGSVFTELD